MSQLPLIKKRISRPHDARAVRSRAALREALLALMQRKPLEQISIKEITAQAEVSYPVFFRQFSSKDDLLADVAVEEIGHLMDRPVPPIGSNLESMRAMCDYVDQHRHLWSSLLRAGASAAMEGEFIKRAEEIGRSRLPAQAGLPVDLVTSVLVGGVFRILSWWLQQPEGYPVEKVVRLLDILVLRTVLDLQDVVID